MSISPDLIETVRNMMVPTGDAVDSTYAEGFNDGLDAVVEMMEALQETFDEEE